MSFDSQSVKPGSGTTARTTLSDERLKEDIQRADIGLCYSNVKKIPLKYYKWRDEVYDDDDDEEVHDKHKLGWIAQDVEAVFPKAVRVVKNVHGLSDCRSLNTEQLYATMFGAFQQMQTMIESLTREVASLRKQVFHFSLSQ